VRQLLSTGAGGIVGILGEAGLGKSRLIAETKSFAVASKSNVVWLEGQHFHLGGTISYLALPADST